ncbi:hypothetical protein ANN_13758 [Periplaneta americana]|uniref:Uncharacterized protein n=1 Tax=Periplaneta americana TaxID=6978 RepID=A0ABQ8SWJ8_PERAM|nr:hypothetical protein ANN_13758 [Periplaneta americana]
MQSSSVIVGEEKDRGTRKRMKRKSKREIEHENSKTFAFDLQQVQSLSKLNIGESYYARQIALYSLCVTNIESTEPIFYIWNETQAGRGAEEVSSAITDFLNKMDIDNSTTSLRFFADGCAGQNKNKHKIHAIAFWLLKKSPPHVTEVHLILCFPVRGHSFLPPDRVFTVWKRSSEKFQKY